MNSFLKRYRFRIIIPAYPIFNIYTRIARKTTALGPVYIATIVNKMELWDAKIIDENNLPLYAPKNNEGKPDHEQIQQKRPADVIGFYGGLTSTIPRLYELASFYKNLGIITIAGGQHFIAENIEEALNHGIDYVVIGEGEETIQQLLSNIMDGEDVTAVKGIAYKTDGKVIKTPPRKKLLEFDQLPLPDFSLVRYARLKLFPVERVRGCGMNCEFCTVKGRPRCATPERLLEQISRLVETRNAREFFIVDDLFGQQRDETIRFCDMLSQYQRDIGKRLEVNCQIRLDRAKDRALLNAMRRAGFSMVAIGFESPIPEELAAMNKKLNPDDMLDFTRIFHKMGF